MGTTFTVNYTDCLKREVDGFSVFRPLGTEDYVFIYFTDEMIFDFPDKRVEAKKNSVIIYEPGAYQKFTAKEQFLSSFIHFTPNNGIMKELSIPLNTILYPNNYEALNSLIKSLQKEVVYDKNHSSLMCDSIIIRLLISLERALSEDKNESLRDRFDAVRLNMIVNCTKSIFPEELAASLHLSKSRFYDYYNKFYGVSPKKEMLKARMELSRVLLTNRNKTVKEIAFEVGFENVEHFTRYYKKHFGHSPRQNINN